MGRWQGLTGPIAHYPWPGILEGNGIVTRAGPTGILAGTLRIHRISAFRI